MPPLRRFLAGAVCALLCVSIVPAAARAQSDFRTQVAERVNALRASYGLPAYDVDPVLMQVAQAQAEWSAANNYIGHDGPGGSSPDDRAQAAGYGGGKRSFATENAANATGSMEVDWVMNGWQGSSVHLDAMISSRYEDMGVGYAEGSGYSWAVLMVGWVDESSTAPTRQPTAVLGMRSTALPDGSIQHVVQSGETAWSIAALYGVPLAELLALNQLTESSLLLPGEVLTVQQAAVQTAAPAAVTPEQVAAAAPDSPTASQPPPPEPPEPRTRESQPAPADFSTLRAVLWGLLAVGIGLLGAGIVSARAHRHTVRR